MELWHLQFILIFGTMTVLPIYIGYLIAKYFGKMFESSFENSPIVSEYWRQLEQEQTKEKLKENRLARNYNPYKHV